MRVLLVDDEAEFVTTLAERLTFRGFKVDYAIRALDALALAENNIYDLAVLDMKMPGTSGLELKGLLEKMPERSAMSSFSPAMARKPTMWPARRSRPATSSNRSISTSSLPR